MLLCLCSVNEWNEHAGLESFYLQVALFLLKVSYRAVLIFFDSIISKSGCMCRLSVRTNLRTSKCFAVNIYFEWKVFSEVE